MLLIDEVRKVLGGAYKEAHLGCTFHFIGNAYSHDREVPCEKILIGGGCKGRQEILFIYFVEGSRHVGSIHLEKARSEGRFASSDSFTDCTHMRKSLLCKRIGCFF